MFFRLAILIGLGTVVATIIYFTPVPEQIFLSCDRPCHHLDWPMICRVKLTLEEFKFLNTPCKRCSSNETECLNRHCNSGDEQDHLLIANRQMPGPSIQVCENDILVVDVINRLPGKSATVHWRGQSQVETPFMDGAPLITQCPIPSYTTFQYKFRASISGTHLWHAHAGTDMKNGIFGSLIVKQADIREPHRSLYDIDDPKHVLLLTQWQDSSVKDSSEVTMLINGGKMEHNGSTKPSLALNVILGRRHRFRVANAAGAGSCPMVLSIDQHSLILIALDGHPINPHMVTSIILAKGERADFILKADKSKSTYWVKLRATDKCQSTPTIKAAAIVYKDVNEKSSVLKEQDLTNRDTAIFNELTMTFNSNEKCESPENLCITEIQAINKMPKSLATTHVDVRMYLPINYTIQRTEFLGNGRMERKIWSLDNTTFTFPSSPLLTQRNDVEQDLLCFGEKNVQTLSKKAEERCNRHENGNVASCDCVHIRRVPLGATVEIILFDQAGLDDLVYHLHGYSFYIVGAKKLEKSMTLTEIKDLDRRNQLFTRNLDCAPLKDTVTVTRYGAVALRFKANNPGYWMLRDEHALEWTRGLDVILQVGEVNDMISAPTDFPKCGSFVGPDYFLI